MELIGNFGFDKLKDNARNISIWLVEQEKASAGHLKHALCNDSVTSTAIQYREFPKLAVVVKTWAIKSKFSISCTYLYDVPYCPVVANCANILHVIQAKWDTVLVKYSQFDKWLFSSEILLACNIVILLTADSSYSFFLDISVQGGKVHEVMPMWSTNPEGTTQRTATTSGNFTPYSFRIVCEFFNVPHWTYINMEGIVRQGLRFIVLIRKDV